MDKLDEQLRQLCVVNHRLSLPNTNKEIAVDEIHIDVPKLVNIIEEKNSSSQDYNNPIYYHDLSATKKVAPLVPPKPMKKYNLPEIPQSSLVKDACEPLYAQRLQSIENDNHALGEIYKQPLRLRKQSVYSPHNADTSSSVSSLVLKTQHEVTLDNPFILEQQLEALEHHKKHLEKRGKLFQNSSSKSKTSIPILNTPKLSSASLLTNVTINPRNFLENADVTYANAMPTNITSMSSAAVSADSKTNLYSNILSPSPLTTTSAICNIYLNVEYDKDQQQTAYVGQYNVGKMLYSTKTKLDSSNANNIYFSHNSIVASDEIQSPSSPVSSSYSELRRATEVFKTNIPKKEPTLNISNHQINLTRTIVGYEMPHNHKLANSLNIRCMNKSPYAVNDGFNNYSTSLQTSSTYESIYEPVNPRSSSQLSTRSRNLIYPTCVKNSEPSSLLDCGTVLGKSTSSGLSMLNGLSGDNSADSNSPLYPNSSRNSEDDTLNNYPHNPKESEVESITDFLVKSINPKQDIENYGICCKCNGTVVSENSGCTAMNQVYHIACFTCSQCQINLQGKPFYALNCEPYCEFDYLQTLEKCSVCMKPILERILRATGKPYHPQCFTCVVCKKSLDGIPFTVDATNQNYCIEDFHRKFAPRCCVCKEPIMPEAGEEETVRVVALDRSFHFECYKCEDCGLLLSSEAEGRGCYPLDDHVLCKSCNADRVQMLTNQMTASEL